jgi:hypothetical protein
VTAGSMLTGTKGEYGRRLTEFGEVSLRNERVQTE